ncbi:hypothetical protein ECZU34_32830 [Escherichia coli]|nr:hypothetical protein ECZU34_32830 [Escherichia coli]
MQELNNHSRNILTVEDPIEYMIEGIGQTQVNTRVGMTFARGLRAILRQDPDVVMVGEIRDTETAEIAVQASLTGHWSFPRCIPTRRWGRSRVCRIWAWSLSCSLPV